MTVTDLLIKRNGLTSAKSDGYMYILYKYEKLYRDPVMFCF
jgi:hypothetical protein